MKHHFNSLFRFGLLITLLGLLFSALSAMAEEIKNKDKEKKTTQEAVELEEILVTARKVDAWASAVVESITLEAIEKKHVVGTEDIFKYLPGLYVRKLYPGATPAPTGLSIRGTHNQTSGRTLVVADGMMLSNYIKADTAPRWSVVGPDEIEQVDVIYGPYSALYSGNAIGGVVSITTRLPEKRKISADTSYLYHNFREYNSRYDLEGLTTHVSYGDKIGKFHILGFYDQSKIDGQPLTYATKLESSGGAAIGNPVTGWVSDYDSTNRKRYILGSGYANEITNNLFKLKTGYDINSYTRVGFDFGYYKIETVIEDPDTYLIDSSGNKVYSGTVDIDGQSYTISDSQFYYQDLVQDNYIFALSLKSAPKDGLKIWVNANYYNIPKDITQRSSTAPPTSINGGAGRVTDATGGWYNFDIKSSYGFAELPAMANHTFTGGYHFDRYFTDSEVWNASDWKHDIRTTLSEDSTGKTEIHAVFLQDEWDLTDNWILCLGGRYEWWRGFDGSKSKEVSGSIVTTDLEEKKEDYFSPKFAITYRFDKNWDLRFSIAKAYRFPTIGELYYGSIASDGTVNNSNPDLKTEKVFAKDFTIMRLIGNGGKARLSFFENSEDNSIYRQTNIYTLVSNYQNIDEVRKRGVEFSVEKKDFLIKGLDVTGNMAYIKAEILKNTKYPASEGKIFPRCPEWTAGASLYYSPVEDLTLTFGGRYASKDWSTLDNTDIRGGYGGMDSYTVFDAKIMYVFLKNYRVSAGVDNLTDELYHSSHPLARRTFFSSLGLVF